MADKDSLKESNSRKLREVKFAERGNLIEAIEDTGGLMWKAQFIEAGLSDNRRNYSPSTLQSALPLFEGARVFIDHPTRTEESDQPERSVLKTAGWITDTQWIDEAGSHGEGAIVGTLHVLESSSIAALMREAHSRGKPDLVQLSIYGSGKQEVVHNNGNPFYNVEVIDKIRSVDLVTYGAAGGRINEIMASLRRENEMALLDDLSLEEILAARPDLQEMIKSGENETEEVTPEVTPDPNPDSEPVVEAQTESTETETTEEVQPDSDESSNEEEILAEIQKVKELADEVSALKDTLETQKCESLARTKVEATELPSAVKAKMVRHFTGRIFETKELEDAINEEVETWAAVLEEHPKPDVTVIRAEGDKLRDVIMATMLNEVYEGQDPLQSIKRAYCMFSGIDPWSLSPQQLASAMIRDSGGFDPMNLREAITWSAVLGDTMNRIMVQDYRLPLYDDWKKIVSDIRPLKDMKTQRIERIGYYEELPTVIPGGTYQYADSPGEVEAEYDPVKKGYLEAWNWEDALNDNLHALRKIPRRLALAAKITFYRFVFSLLTANAVTTYDNIAVFDLATHANLATNTLTSANLTTARAAMRNQAAADSAITFLGIVPKILIVPNELEALANQFVDSPGEVTSNQDATVSNPHKGRYDVIVVDSWTDADAWYVVADPRLCPTIEVGFLGGKQVPELFMEVPNTGSHFSADKVVTKIRFVYGGAVVEHRGMYASIPED